jgi:hypothetical protein
MSPSPYSLDGARQLLCGPRNSLAKTLDALLGLAILGSGAVAVTTGNPAFLIPFQWIDQKNELVRHLEELIKRGRQRLGDSTGRERQDVIAATHTTLVVGAFLASMQELLGPAYSEIQPTDDELKLLLTPPARPDDDDEFEQRRRAKLGETSGRHSELVEHLLNLRIHLPWTACGFEQNAANHIVPFYRDLAVRYTTFLDGFVNFARWRNEHGYSQRSDRLVTTIVGMARRRYEAEYLRLAVDVREFLIWALFGEVRIASGQLSEVVASFQRHEGISLGKFEDLIKVLRENDAREASAGRTALNRIHQSVLVEPLIPTKEIRNFADVVFPSVQKGYVEPAFRWMVMGDTSRPADENWWGRQTYCDDLSTFLAAHLSSDRSASLPLVVLGHPGSGKSLMTKVCAARLASNDAFAAVRLELREVRHPNAPVYQQIQQALHDATNGQTSWDELRDGGDADRVRVVFIDGLDELMQATGLTESQYLQNVVEFQRIEWVSRQPVVVVVTSRTVVADLAAIPAGCVVLRLEDFDDRRIHVWLDSWNAANKAMPRAGAAALTAEEVLRHEDLARQPLLLLLLTLYRLTRDPEDAALTEVHRADLYGGLLTDFIRRELAKTHLPTGPPGYPPPINAELWKLGVAAFGVLNRGRHYIGEHQLIDDLAALNDDTPLPKTEYLSYQLDPARRVIGRFFFVHTAETHGGGQGRSYEFLHATFGDYLVALHIVEELVDLDLALRKGTSQRWDDDRLFALISHQPLQATGSTILSFVAQLVGARNPESQQAVQGMLRTLIGRSPERWERGRFAAYDPSRKSGLQRTAMYSANLLLLLMAVADARSERVTLDWLAPTGVDHVDWWRSIIALWEGGLGVTARSQVFRHLDVHPDGTLLPRTRSDALIPSVHALLLGLSWKDALIASEGHGFRGKLAGSYPEYPLIRVGAELGAALANGHPQGQHPAVIDYLGSTEVDTDENVVALLAFIQSHPDELPYGDLAAFLARREAIWPDHFPKIAVIVVQHPDLLTDVRGLGDALVASEHAHVHSALLVGTHLWSGDQDSALREITGRMKVRWHQPAGMTAEFLDALAVVGSLSPALKRMLIPALMKAAGRT